MNSDTLYNCASRMRATEYLNAIRPEQRDRIINKVFFMYYKYLQQRFLDIPDEIDIYKWVKCEKSVELDKLSSNEFVLTIMGLTIYIAINTQKISIQSSKFSKYDILVNLSEYTHKNRVQMELEDILKEDSAKIRRGKLSDLYCKLCNANDTIPLIQYPRGIEADYVKNIKDLNMEVFNHRSEIPSLPSYGTLHYSQL
jgi:hypothetical protein